MNADEAGARREEERQYVEEALDRMRTTTAAGDDSPEVCRKCGTAECLEDARSGWYDDDPEPAVPAVATVEADEPAAPSQLQVAPELGAELYVHDSGCCPACFNGEPSHVEPYENCACAAVPTVAPGDTQPDRPHLVDAAAPAMREALRRVELGQLSSASAVDVMLDWPSRALAEPTEDECAALRAELATVHARYEHSVDMTAALRDAFARAVVRAGWRPAVMAEAGAPAQLDDAPLRQGDVHAWSVRNFGQLPQTIVTLGLAEEVGELCRAVLKREQGIRGTREEWDAEVRKELGDCVIKLLDIAAYEDADLMTVASQRWAAIRERNWIANPNGHGLPGTTVAGSADGIHEAAALDVP